MIYFVEVIIYNIIIYLVIYIYILDILLYPMYHIYLSYNIHILQNNILDKDYYSL